MFREPALRMAKRVAEAAPRRLLETAAGTGIVTRELAVRLPDFDTFVVTDLNPAALAVAQEMTGERERVSFHRADATALPFGDGSFDALVCQFGIMLFPDKQRAYQEARRVLEPGGRLFLTVWDARSRNPFAEVLTGVIERFFETDAPRYFDTPYAYHALDEIRASLQGSGFGDISARVVRAKAPIGDAALFAEGFVFGTQFRDTLAARGVDAFLLRNRIAAAFEAELKGETALQYLMIEAVAC